MNKWMRIGFTTMGVLFSLESLATDYFVNLNGGSNSYNGLAPDFDPDTGYGPFATFAKGLRTVTPGDRLILRGGLYTEKVTLDNSLHSNGTESAPIIVTNFDNEEVTIRTTARFRIQNLEWWTFDGLKFDNTNSILIGERDSSKPHEGPGSQCTHQVQHLRIVNSEFRNSMKSGIIIRCAADVVIINNIFDNLRSREVRVDRHGVTFQHFAHQIQISDNIFSDMGAHGVHFLEGESNSFVNIDISNNEFFIIRPYKERDTNGNPVPEEQWQFQNVGENGIAIKYGPGPIVISSNIFHGFRPTTRDENNVSIQDASGSNGNAIGIIFEASGVIVKQNHFYDNLAHIVLGPGKGATPYSSRNTDIHDNIFDLTFQLAIPDTPLRESVGVRAWNVSDVHVFNNTFATGNRAFESGTVRTSLFKNNLLLDGTIELVDAGPEGHDWDAAANAYWPGLIPPTEFDDPSNKTHNGSPVDIVDWTPIAGSIIIDNGIDANADPAIVMVRTNDFYGNPIIDHRPDGYRRGRVPG